MVTVVRGSYPLQGLGSGGLYLCISSKTGVHGLLNCMSAVRVIQRMEVISPRVSRRSSSHRNSRPEPKRELLSSCFRDFWFNEKDFGGP